MTNYFIYPVPVLLLLSTILFRTLIPGGPVETRRFSHYSPVTLGLFNTFPAILGLGSLAISYFFFVGSRWAFLGAALCGVSCLPVCALDLGKVFPVSPDRMSRALFVIEVTGLLLSIPLILLSLISVSMLKNPAGGFQISMVGAGILSLMVLFGVGIVIFATRVTMKR